MIGAMTDQSGPRAYWRERFFRHGHVGETNRIVYAYDQPMRLRSLERALTWTRTGLVDARVLDCGCGTGDVVERWAGRGVRPIVGIDFSQDVVRYARGRLATREAAFLVSSVEQLALADDHFDVVISVNVLQHVQDGPPFRLAIGELARVVRAGGRIVLVEFAPIASPAMRERDQLTIRARAEYINALADQGCVLVGEYGLPRLGVRLCRSLVRAVRWVRPVGDKVPADSEPVVPTGNWLKMLRGLVVHLILLASWPFDYLLLPVAGRWSDMPVLIFERRPDSPSHERQ